MPKVDSIKKLQVADPEDDMLDSSLPSGSMGMHPSDSSEIHQVANDPEDEHDADLERSAGN